MSGPEGAARLREALLLKRPEGNFVLALGGVEGRWGLLGSEQGVPWALPQLLSLLGRPC